MHEVPESQLIPILQNLINATDKTAKDRKTAVVWFNRLFYDVRRWNESFINFLKTYPAYKEKQNTVEPYEEYQKFESILNDYQRSLNSHYGSVKGDLCTNLRVLSQRFSKDFEWLHKTDPIAFRNISEQIQESYATEKQVITLAQQITSFIYELEKDHNNKARVVMKINEYIEYSNHEVLKLHDIAEKVGINLLSVSEYEEAIHEEIKSNPAIMVIGEVDLSQDRSIHIKGNVSSSHLNTGENQVNTISGSFIGNNSISIGTEYLEKMPKEYAESLQAFTAELNQNLENTKVPSDDMKQLQDSVTELAKEMVDVNPGVSISTPKKLTIGMKLSNLAKAVVKASPKFAETIVSMTPLAPFSKLVGTTFENIVADWLKEKNN